MGYIRSGLGRGPAVTTTRREVPIDGGALIEKCRKHPCGRCRHFHKIPVARDRAVVWMQK